MRKRLSTVLRSHLTQNVLAPWIMPRSAGCGEGGPSTTEREVTMFKKLAPGAIHRRLWPALLVIGLIGLVGLAMMFMVSGE